MLPFAEIYGLITDFRNWLYEKKYFKSARFQIPVISIGNLSVGGTGKSPHIAYLIGLLQANYKVGTLSRGYGRKTRDYQVAQLNSTVEQVGDEPLMFKLKYPQTQVSVGIDRLQTIPRILADAPYLDVILLDDAFQHRSVRAGLNILLTDYTHPFTTDFLLPAGRLRERRKNYHRGDIIIVTKCPSSISTDERKTIANTIKPLSYQHLYFSTMRYGKVFELFSELITAFKSELIDAHQNVYRYIPADVVLKDNCLLVTGIANGLPLETELKQNFKNVYTQHYADHYNFDEHDLEVIRTAFNDIGSENCMIVTTEKDAMRFLKHKSWFITNKIQIYCQPISVEFLGDDSVSFNADILKYIQHDLAVYKPELQFENQADNNLQ